MATTEARKMYRTLGTTQDVTECQHCGLANLKGTIILGVLDADGNVEDVTYFGAVCGAKAAGWTATEIRKSAKAADDGRHEAGRLAQSNASRAWLAARDEWIAKNIGADALSNPRKYGYRSPYAIVKAYQEATSA